VNEKRKKGKSNEKQKMRKEMDKGAAKAEGGTPAPRGVYIRDERSRVESYRYVLKEGQQYINVHPGHLFVQQPPKKGMGSRGSFKLLRYDLPFLLYKPK